MQESNTTAQNKLGELFVEFGAKGLGGLINGLNGISAQFLLTKNAAEQAIKPIWGMSKKVSGSVTEFNKLNAVTGMSVSHLMKMRKWAELNDIDFGDYIGQIKNLQMSMREALINRNPQILQGFSMLGISPNELDFKNPEKVLAKLQSRIKQLDPVTRTMALNLVNLDEEMVYAMTRANKSIDKNLLLTKAQEKNLQEVNSATKELEVTWSSVGEHLIGDWSNLDNIILGVNNRIKKFIEFLDGNQEKKIQIIADFTTNISKDFQHFMSGFKVGEALKESRSGAKTKQEDFNFISKLIYGGSRNFGAIEKDIEKGFGIKSFKNEDFWKGYYNQNNSSNVNPNVIKQNASRPVQNVGQIGNREFINNNEINVTINADNNELNNPILLGNGISQQILNNLSDSYQSYNTRYGEN